MRHLLTVLAISGCLAAGCEASRPGDSNAITSEVATPTSAPTACHPAIGIKLGQPFLRVCPASSGGAPFWIHGKPVPCGEGEHEVIPCPPVLALRTPGVPEGLSPPKAVRSVLTDASTAHRLCAMRYAGRLPTRVERARAAEALGLASLAVVESAGPAGSHLDFRAVPEWVTEVPCSQPSVLGPECGAGTMPARAGGRLDPAEILTCDADPSGVGTLPIVALDESCPAGDALSGPGERLLPCAVGLRARAGAYAARFAMRCRRIPPAPGAAISGSVQTAAIRCVVPESLLDAPVR